MSNGIRKWDPRGGTTDSLEKLQQGRKLHQGLFQLKRCIRAYNASQAFGAPKRTFYFSTIKDFYC